MAASNFFQSLFNRPTYLNVYENQVLPHISFESRSNVALESLYTELVEVRIIEDFIADFISRIPAGVFDMKDREVFRSPLNQLITQSNSEQTFQELLKEFLVFYGLTGNGYMLHYNGFLYTLPTSEVTILTGLPVEVPEWRNYVDSYLHYYEGIEYKIAGDDVMHMKAAQLKSARGTWVYGSSPYSSAEPNIKSLEATNSARVSTMNDRGALGFITNDSEFPDPDQTEKAQEAMQKYGLKEGQYKFLVSSQKLRYQKMSLNMEELRILENLEVDFTRLCELRGIDPIIFSTENATYANQASAYKGTVKKALLPMAYHFYDKFNLWLKQIGMSGTLRVLPKVDELPDYSELGIEQSARMVAEVAAGIMSREQALGILYPDLEWIEDAPQMMQVVQANNNTNGTPTEEEEKFINFKI